jgi:hypothetical protein
MAGVEDGEVVLEEAISWLPSHIVLDHEALWDSKVYQYIYRYCFIDKTFQPENTPNESQVLVILVLFLCLSFWSLLVLVLKISEPCFILGLCEAPTASPPSISQSS